MNFIVVSQFGILLSKFYVDRLNFLLIYEVIVKKYKNYKFRIKNFGKFVKYQQI